MTGEQPSLGGASTGPSGDVDWGVGRYELTAVELLPAALRLVELADVQPGQRVLDVGCGIGSVALAAASRRARVHGIDPARRLLAVAREKAADAGLDVTFVPGTAAQLPFGDGSADVILSSFALIFAPDPKAAAAELVRVLAPGGRIMFTAFLPESPFVKINRLVGAASRAARGAARGPAPFPWHDPGEVAELFAPHGMRLRVAPEQLAITAPSAAQYITAQSRAHPVVATALALVDQYGDGQALRSKMLDILEKGNESDTEFLVTSRYVIATLQR